MTKKLIITRGVPACGKTTWAEEYVWEHGLMQVVNLCRDDFREQLYGVTEKTVLSQNREEHVTREQRKAARYHLLDNKTVIISDTNTRDKYVEPWRELAEELNAEFEIKTFDTPLAECIRRNENRPENERVPESVIKRMWRQMNPIRKAYDRPFNVSAEKEMAIIFDMDGTVRLMNGRNPYDSKAAIGDIPNVPVILMIKALMYTYPRATFIALSGAHDNSYDVVEDQLIDWGIEPSMILMRKTGDNRKDSIIKKEIYQDEIEPFFNVAFVIDDRNQVVEMWRDLGLHCFQVADGDF